MQPMPLGRLLSRVKFDYYLLALLATVAIAAVLPARGAAAPIAKYAVYAAVFLLFFLYGARLSTQAVVQGISHWRLQSLVLLSTFALFPLIGLGLTAALSRWLPVDLAAGLMFVCVLPSTVQSSIAFTSIARGNVPAALCSASVSNLAGMVLTPLLVAALLATHGSGFSLKALTDIALELLLPFGLGQVLRPWVGPWITRQKHVLSYVDRGSILLVVYAAFGESVVAGVWSHMDPWSLVLVFALDAALLALVLALTTVVSRTLGFSKEDEITIVFCGSKKSLASGIPMANILFPGAAVGAIVLPLMIFHQIQLFACATLAQRYARRPLEAPASVEGAPVRA
nr:bile acid:sodium symporter family protein [Lichenibacterium sp. 6Y81]